MKTEEILNRNLKEGGFKLDLISKPETLQSMEEYAEQQACEFLDSIREYENENKSLIAYDERTSKELYNQFLHREEQQ